jgi:hypothetical protein
LKSGAQSYAQVSLTPGFQSAHNFEIAKCGNREGLPDSRPTISKLPNVAIDRANQAIDRVNQAIGSRRRAFSRAGQK